MTILLTMRSIAFVLTCLACTGYGRHLRPQRPESSLLVARRKPFKSADSFGKADRRRCSQLEALAGFLSAFNPKGAFVPGCVPFRHSTLNNFHAAVQDRQHSVGLHAPVMSLHPADSSSVDGATGMRLAQRMRESCVSLFANVRRLGKRCRLHSRCLHHSLGATFSRVLAHARHAEERHRPLFRRVRRCALCAAFVLSGIVAIKPAVLAATDAAAATAAAPASYSLMKVVKEFATQVTAGERDVLVLLLASAFVSPLMNYVRLSPVLGFLFAGMILGPNGIALISDVSTTQHLAELGVVFFLFEMGLELELEAIKAVGKDAFRIGTSQFVLTALAIGGIALAMGQSVAAAVVLGGGLALSSSAFVIQLLQESGELATRFGRAAFGTLLFQDLAVVPLLVVTPLLDSTGAALASALKLAGLKAVSAVALAFVTGRLFLNRVFRLVASAKDQTSFLAITLFTVLAMSTFTAGLGLSDTLGAFLAGVLLAETKFRYQVEADIAPFKGILLGLFFITTGFEIDLPFTIRKAPQILGLAFSLHVIKTLIASLVCYAGGLKKSGAFRTGLILSQGGEFAFVLFGLAQASGILPPQQVKLLLTMVVVTMFLTPFLNILGKNTANLFEKDKSLPVIEDMKEDEKDTGDYIMVCGYGRVGEIVCSMLTSKLVRYKAFDIDPYRVAEARAAGLPVYMGDATRQDVLKSFLKEGEQAITAVVVALDKESDSTKAVQALRREYPKVDDMPIFVRAVNERHLRKMRNAGATALVTGPQEASLLLGGAALSRSGVEAEDVLNTIEERRKDLNRDYMDLISRLKKKKKEKRKEKKAEETQAVEKKRDEDEQLDEEKQVEEELEEATLDAISGALPQKEKGTNTTAPEGTNTTTADSGDRTST